MPLSNVETERIFRSLTGITDAPVNAEQLKVLLNKDSMFSSEAESAVYQSRYGDQVRSFKGKGFDVTAVTKVPDRVNGPTFVANLRYFSGPAKKPVKTMEFAVKIHAPRFDSFRDRLEYAYTDVTKVVTSKARMNTTPAK